MPLDPAERVRRFQALVASEPDNALHAFALAQALLGAGRAEEAAAAYGRCLELDPQWMIAAIRRGRCLVELRRWEEARAVLELGARLASAQNHDEPFAEIRALMEQIPAS